MQEFIEKTVITADDKKIQSRIFSPEEKIQGAVLIVPAMGTAQDYYQAFATWLAQQGMLAVTFDYRGIGLSRTGSLRGFQATILDWARFDCSAMIQTVTELSSDKPLYWLGHSLGGQILPFVPEREKITKIINIAAGSGYWRENASPLNRYSWWLWNLVEPVSVFLCGYFPGKNLKIVGDLPKGVIAQWRRWCMNSEYAIGVEGPQARELYAAVQTPMLSLSFSDDEFMSAKSIETMNNFYANSPKIIKHISPAEVGLHRIGHFGFFRSQNKDLLWSNFLSSYLELGKVS